MNIWETLGIAETADQEEIKNAYRSKLLVTNPEDDPEGFKVLRAAYEEAVKAASSFGVSGGRKGAGGSAENDDEEGNEMSDESVEDAELSEERFLDPQTGSDFKKCIAKIYGEFYKRIDSAEWNRLVETDFATSLDTSEEAMNIVLSFFMGHIYLPQHIFRILVDAFGIEIRRKELSQRFPKDYIDYFINNAIYPDVLDYRFFSGPEDADYDGYISRYADLDQAIKAGNTDIQDELIEELGGSEIKNPALSIAVCRNLVQKKRYDEALDRIRELDEKYPDHRDIILCMGDVYMAMDRFGEAGESFDRLLSLEPENLAARIRKSELNIKEEKFEAAKDDLMKLAHDRPYDNYIRGLIQKCNSLIIETNLKKIEELSSEMDDHENGETDNKDSDNNDGLINSEEVRNASESDKERQIHRLKIDTSWAYYQSFAPREAVKLLESMEPFPDEVIEYNNLLGRSYLLVDENLKARKCFLIWMDQLENATEKDEKQQRRKPYVNYLLGATYFNEKDYQTAEGYIDNALRTEHEEIIVSYEMKCEILYETGRYSECLTECEQVLAREENFVAQLYIAKTLFRLGNYQMALDEVAKVKSIFPYSVVSYKLEMDIFLTVDQYDDVLRVAETYRKIKPDSACCSMMESEVYMNRDKDYEKALGILSAINPDDDGCDIEDLGEYFFVLARCLEEGGQLEKAEECFKKVLSHNERDIESHRALGRIARKRLKFNEAIDEYTKQIELAPKDTDYIFRAITYKILGKYSEAEKDYETVMQFTDPAPYIYTLAAENQLMLNKYKEAVGLFIKGRDGAENDMDKLRAWKGLAAAYGLNEEYDKAFHEYEELVKDRGYIADVVFPYEELLSARGRFSEAEALVSRLLYGSQKVDEKVFTRLCRMKCRAGDIKGAEAIYKRAGDEGIKLRALAFYLGHAYLSIKDYAKAEKFFLQGMEGSEYTAYSELAEAAAGQFGGKTRFKRYKELFEKYREINDKNTETLVDAARIARVEKNYTEAEELLLEALRQPRCKHCTQSCCGEAYKELVKVYLGMKQKDKAKEALKQARRYMFYDFWLEETAKELGVN